MTTPKYNSRANIRSIVVASMCITLILLTSAISHRYLGSLLRHEPTNINTHVLLALIIGTWFGMALIAEFVNMLFISRAVFVQDKEILCNLLKRKIFSTWLSTDYVMARVLWGAAASIMLVGIRDNQEDPRIALSFLWAPVCIAVMISSFLYGWSILKLITSCLDTGVRVDHSKG